MVLVKQYSSIILTVCFFLNAFSNTEAPDSLKQYSKSDSLRDSMNLIPSATDTTVSSLNNNNFIEIIDSTS
jgi:hypothetical protein